MNEYIVRYIGADSVDLRKGELYSAHDLKDSSKLIGVKDRSGEWYAYPKELFEKAAGAGKPFLNWESESDARRRRIK